MRKIKELLEKYPSLSNVPVAIIGGKPVTLKELAEMKEVGNEEAEKVLEKLGMDPGSDELKELAKRSVPEGVRVYILGKSLTREELLKNIEEETEVGREFIEMYRRLLRRLFGGA